MLYYNIQCGWNTRIFQSYIMPSKRNKPSNVDLAKGGVLNAACIYVVEG